MCTTYFIFKKYLSFMNFYNVIKFDLHCYSIFMYSLSFYCLLLILYYSVNLYFIFNELVLISISRDLSRLLVHFSIFMHIIFLYVFIFLTVYTSLVQIDYSSKIHNITIE